MKVVTAPQMREIDRRTIEQEGVPSLTLMENAGQGVFQVVREYLADEGRPRVVVLCGRGNNGGDGLVVARKLREADVNPVVFLAGDPKTLSGDAAANYRRAREESIDIHEVAAESVAEVAAACGEADVVVDALLGTGISGEVTGVVGDLIDAIDQSEAVVVAVDVPSGLNADDGTPCGRAVVADATPTMGLPKLGLVLPSGRQYAGSVRVVDIGVPEHVIEEADATAEILTGSEARALLPPRPLDAHKGDFGRVLVVAGSVGMTGAAALCSEAALRIGAGLVYLAIPRGLNDLLEIKLTEVITCPMPETRRRSLALASTDKIVELAAQCDAVALGPGLSQDPETQQVVYRLVDGIDRPLVIDADGLNALRRHENPLPARTAPTVITPHPGEMARLLGTTTDEIQTDRMGAARRAAEQFRSVVVLKGAGTITTQPGDGLCTINTTGNPGMASGGTGDVLTGMIAGLLAQHVAPLSPYDAARLGVYLHGLAGDLAAAETGQMSMIAGDVLRHVATAVRRIQEGS